MLVNTEVFCREKVADQGDYFLLILSNLNKTCSAASLQEKLPCEPGRNIQSLLLSRKKCSCQRKFCCIGISSSRGTEIYRTEVTHKSLKLNYAC